MIIAEEVTLTDNVLNNVLFYDSEKCTGCLFCEAACAFKHSSQLDFNLCNLKVTTSLHYDENSKLTSYKFNNSYCIHCDPAACQLACPNDAIVKEPNGRIFLNEINCIGCRNCNLACSIGVPWLDPALKITHKCDLCDGDPQCVSVCSAGAIQFISREEAIERSKSH